VRVQSQYVCASGTSMNTSMLVFVTSTKPARMSRSAKSTSVPSSHPGVLGLWSQGFHRFSQRV